MEYALITDNHELASRLSEIYGLESLSTQRNPNSVFIIRTIERSIQEFAFCLEGNFELIEFRGGYMFPSASREGDEISFSC